MCKTHIHVTEDYNDYEMLIKISSPESGFLKFQYGLRSRCQHICIFKKEFF